jgi:MarR family transcriptional regulator for hemolysin
MPPPSRPPIGRQLAHTSKIVGRAFDDALTAAGGSLSTWLVLIAVKSQELANQRELADVVGIREATLTHHLNAMESDGLIVRRRDPENRRIQRVELTTIGEDLFGKLRTATVAFDRQLTTGVSATELAQVSAVLDHLRTNVGT